MKLSDLGEFGLIDRISQRFKDLPKDVEGIGDDCAIIPANEEISNLVTTDLLIENIHFISSKISPYDLGFKALAVNLSDIAAMGGSPKYAFLSIGLTADIDVQWIDAFYDGFHDLAKSEGVSLLGGDTSFSKSDLIINVTLIGEIDTKKIKRRHGAKLGDVICCTGNLGDSAAGLQVLLNNIPEDTTTIPLINAHHKPRAHTNEGRWLAEHSSVHAMIDVSDGIDSDLPHILRASNCGATIELENLPMSLHLKDICHKYNWNPWELAATGGEDYCLLLTVDAKEYETLNIAFLKAFKRPLYSIGKITSDKTYLSYSLNGKPTHLKKQGFSHF